MTLGAVLFGTTATSFRERAARLEGLGFGSFSVGDHVTHHPPLAACAAIAAGTSRARVGPHHVTGDRQGAAERAATALGLTPGIVRDSPYVLIGSPAEIAAQLGDHHERVGITRWTIFADRPDLQPGEQPAPMLGEIAS